jgi:hypothetical protein
MYGTKYQVQKLEPNTNEGWPTTHATQAKKSLFQNLRNGKKPQVLVFPFSRASNEIVISFEDLVSSFSTLMSGISMITRSKFVNLILSYLLELRR